MSNVIDLRSFCERHPAPVLVLLDLHEGHDEIPETAPILETCRTLLAHAREEEWSIGFVRPIHIGSDGRPWSPCWLHGFAPRRADMIFDRNRPSCYASTNFADAITEAGGAFALAGFFGNIAGLSTLSDAYHHGHRVTFLFDACASEPLSGLAHAESHRALAALADSYGNCATAANWIEAADKFQQENGTRSAAMR